MIEFPETMKLFDADAYAQGFDAKVLSAEFKQEHNDNKSPKILQVVLDRTLFFPEEGGQTPDIGEINGFPVIDVQLDGNVIRHMVRIPAAKESDQAEETDKAEASDQAEETGKTGEAGRPEERIFSERLTNSPSVVMTAYTSLSTDLPSLIARVAGSSSSMVMVKKIFVSTPSGAFVISDTHAVARKIATAWINNNLM
jgi:hypothetical protein